MPNRMTAIVNAEGYQRDKEVARLHEKIDDAVLPAGEHPGVEGHKEKHQQLGAEGARSPG